MAVTLDPDLLAASRPGLPRLVRVEIRKLVDTRSGRWLVAAIVAVTVAAVALVLVFEKDRSALTASPLFELSLLPAAVLLPVLGILTVTTEWSQRTALTTFALVPHRTRVMAAKVLAAGWWSLVTCVAAYLTAQLANLLIVAFDLGDGDAAISWGLLGGGTLAVVLSVLMGVAFGAALISTPLAIVLYFVLPIGLSAVGAVVSQVERAGAWVDINRTLIPLSEGRIDGDGWAKLAVSLLIWLVLPAAVGAWRLTREIK